MWIQHNFFGFEFQQLKVSIRGYGVYKESCNYLVVVISKTSKSVLKKKVRMVYISYHIYSLSIMAKCQFCNMLCTGETENQ